MDRRVSTRRRVSLVGLSCAAACCMAVAAQGQLADPTRPPAYQARDGQAQRPWDLTSTLVSPRRRVAVINGRVVREGGRIDGMTVVKISAGQVILKGPGGEQAVPLVQHTVKAPARRGGER